MTGVGADRNGDKLNFSPLFAGGCSSVNQGEGNLAQEAGVMLIFKGWLKTNLKIDKYSTPDWRNQSVVALQISSAFHFHFKSLI